MKLLDNNSLYEALVRCGEHKNYEVMIVFGSKQQYLDFAKEIADMHYFNPIPGLYKVYVEHLSESRINFYNGSRIELIGISKNIRGHKCNELLYAEDVDISNDEIYAWLANTTVPYRCGNYESLDGHPMNNGSYIRDRVNELKRYKEASMRSEELDEFLGSFVINE